MRTGDAVPQVGPDASFGELMREMGDKGMGASAVASAQGQVLGLFTAGDPCAAMWSAAWTCALHWRATS